MKNNFKKKKILLDTKLFKKDFIDMLIFNLKSVNSYLTHDKEQIVDKLWVKKHKEEKNKIFMKRLWFNCFFFGLAVKIFNSL